jgi:hypothetical protein
MIICDDREFAFIHIPKCAGTSVRRALRGIDTTGEAFFKIADHPVMGGVHLAHLTLEDLAEHYPETFDKVVRYRSMAIVRHPLDRFYSAIFQRLREFKEVAQSAISTEMLETDAEAVIAYLERASGRLDLEHVHFNRQCEFVEFNRERIVRDVFPVTRMTEAAEHVREVAGVEIGDEKRNRTTQLRFGPLRPLQRLLRDRYAKLVSAERRALIREKMTRAGFYGEVPKEALVKPGGRIERFVRDYYARDFEIFEQSEQRLRACSA